MLQNQMAGTVSEDAAAERPNHWNERWNAWLAGSTAWPVSGAGLAAVREEEEHYWIHTAGTDFRSSILVLAVELPEGRLTQLLDLAIRGVPLELMEMPSWLLSSEEYCDDEFPSTAGP